MVANKISYPASVSQSDKFKQAALELETDDDPARFKDLLGKRVKHKPIEKPA